MNSSDSNGAAVFDIPPSTPPPALPPAMTPYCHGHYHPINYPLSPPRRCCGVAGGEHHRSHASSHDLKFSAYTGPVTQSNVDGKRARTFVRLTPPRHDDNNTVASPSTPDVFPPFGSGDSVDWKTRESLASICDANAEYWTQSAIFYRSPRPVSLPRAAHNAASSNRQQRLPGDCATPPLTMLDGRPIPLPPALPLCARPRSSPNGSPRKQPPPPPPRPDDDDDDDDSKSCKSYGPDGGEIGDDDHNSSASDGTLPNPAVVATVVDQQRRSSRKRERSASMSSDDALAPVTPPQKAARRDTTDAASAILTADATSRRSHVSRLPFEWRAMARHDVLESMGFLVDRGSIYQAGCRASQRFRALLASPKTATTSLRLIAQAAMAFRLVEPGTGLAAWCRQNGPLAHQMAAIACYFYVRPVNDAAADGDGDDDQARVPPAPLPTVNMHVPLHAIRALGKKSVVAHTRVYRGYTRDHQRLPFDFPWEKVSTRAAINISLGAPCCERARNVNGESVASSDNDGSVCGEHVRAAVWQGALFSAFFDDSLASVPNA